MVRRCQAAVAERVKVNNLQDEVPLPDGTLGLLIRALEAVLIRDAPGDSILSLSLVDDESMSDLNLRFRNKDGPTDVLSFSMAGDFGPGDEDGDSLLGDVIISVPTAQRQAPGSLEVELVWLSVHGALHLLGYDHRTEDEMIFMDSAARKIIAGLEGVGP